MQYRVTEQVATVVEYSYDVKAASPEQAQDEFEQNRDSYDYIDWELIRKNAEIVGVEELG